MKKLIILIIVLVSTLSGFSQFDLVVTTQNTFNTLQYYPSIYKNLIITTTPGQDSSTMITDLTPLLGVDSIYGNLEIKNTALTNLNGLQNIESVLDVRIYGNLLLKNASSFQIPKRVGRVFINDNPNLEALSGFNSNLKLDKLEIENNANLKTIDLSLESLIKVDSKRITIGFSKNDSLTSIRINDPSESVTDIRLIENIALNHFHLGHSNDTIYTMVIVDNLSFINLTGFQNVSTFGMLNIKRNTNLENLCVVKNAYINGSVASLDVENNGTGANSKSEIMATDCTDFNTGIASVLNYEELELYPNPANNEVYVGVQERSTSYTIYDISGKIVNQGLVESSGRISLETISNGMYVLMVGDKRSKLIVQ